MRTRAISALIGIVLFLALCFGGLLPFTIAVLVVAGLCSYEWTRAYASSSLSERGHDSAAKPEELKQIKVRPFDVFCALCSLAFPAMVFLGLASGHHLNGIPWLASVDSLGRVNIIPLDVVLLFIPVACFACLVWRAARTGYALGGLKRRHALIGFVYIGVLFSSFIQLRALNAPSRIPLPAPLAAASHSILVAPFGGEQGAWLMLFVAVCVWMTDTGAYLVGRSVGKHKLAPTLSPGKTVEGSLGGLLGALLTGLLFSYWIQISPLHGLAIGAIAGVFGQLGDLFESALKRELGLKDFGNLMPGHGGALDRFDSLLFVTPLAFLYLHLVARL